MKLSKKSILYRTVSRVTGLMFFILVLSGPAALLAIPLLLIGVAAYEHLYWKKYEFFIEEGDIKINSGVLTLNKLDIPVRRIQNVNINRNLVHRVFDIAELKIETAGGSTTEASLRYLDAEDAEKVRNQIRQLKDRRTQEAEKQDKDSSEDYQLTNKNLAILSMASSAPSTAIILGLLIITGLSTTSIYAQSLLESVGGLLATITGAIILSIAWMALNGVSTFTKYYGFTVERKNDSIEYEMGLINRQGGTIPKEKIQTLVIEENFLKRFLGFATLKVETAGTNIEQEGLNTSTVLIPLDKRENIVKYMEKIGKFHIPEMQRIDQRAQKRYTHRYLMASFFVAVPILGLSAFGFNPVLILIPVVVALSSKKASQLKWNNIGYGFENNNLFVMKGFWKRKTYSVPYFRIQNLANTESVFQRRWQQASIIADTAGSIWTNPVIPDMDREKASEIRDELFENFQSSIC